MKDNVRVAEAIDVLEIDPHSSHEGEPDIKQRVLEALRRRSVVAYTILDDHGRPIAIVGGQMIFSKVAELWALVDKRVIGYPKLFCKISRKLLETHIQSQGLKRVQMYVRSDFKWAFSFGMFFDCKLDGVLAGFGEDGKQYYLFSKVGV